MIWGVKFIIVLEFKVDQNLKIQSNAVDISLFYTYMTSNWNCFYIFLNLKYFRFI